MPVSKVKVIVVDDDESMNQALERLLNAAGFRAITFSSAEALLADGAAAGAACLILDINLPGLSGFDLCRQLQQSGIKPPVIFITGHDERAAQLQAREIGAIAYFSKPVGGKLLLDAIAQALGGSVEAQLPQ